MFKSMIAISAGASLGAILRWLLGLMLNGIFQPIPIGTLAANWLGAYLIGFALSLFISCPALGPEIRLFVITGFLGGLTTFSTFSAEAAMLLQEQRLFTALGLIALHICGSLVLLFLGMATFALAKTLLR